MNGRLTMVPPDRDEEAALWCLRLAESRLLTDDEQKQLDDWLFDPANVAAIKDQIHLWELTGAMAGLPEMIAHRTAALESYRAAQAERWAGARARRFGGWRAGAIAAMVALVMIVGTTMMLYVPSSTYRTAQGERRVVILADRSRLSLDADTEVKVRMSRDRRELQLLHGRAKFDVASNALRPFVVTAGDRSVLATGTAFSVEILGPKIAVVLYQGHVSVFDAAGKSDNSAHSLNAGSMLIESASGPSAVRIRSINDARSLAWTAGRLSFVDEPLVDALVRVNRYAERPIQIGDAAAATARVTGVFNAEDTEAFLEGLSMVNKLRIDRQPDRIVLTGG